MKITEAKALAVLPLETMKSELRVLEDEHAHDVLITSQIVSAVSYLSVATGRVADAKYLRMAAVALVREIYDGRGSLPDNPAWAAWAEPFRKLAG